MRAVLIKDGLVVNAIEVGHGYEPPSDHVMVETETAQIGDRYKDEVFTSGEGPPSQRDLIEHAWRRFDAIPVFPIRVGSDIIMMEGHHRSLLHRLAQAAAAGKLDHIEWPKGRTVPETVKLDAARIIALDQAVADFELRHLVVLAALCDGIRNGKVTENKQIDDPPPGFPRWPPRYFEPLA